MEEYRTDQYDNVYAWDDEHQAYIFIGKLNGDTLEGFIEDFENQGGL